MSTVSSRVYQPNFGKQVSNLGILWVVLLIHIINAGYAFYGFAKCTGGEVVLCFLALCFFSLGRWMCACCAASPEEGPQSERKLNYKALNQLAGENTCNYVEPSTRRYYMNKPKLGKPMPDEDFENLDDDQINEGQGQRGGRGDQRNRRDQGNAMTTSLYRFPDANDYKPPPNTGRYKGGYLPDETNCGFSRTGKKLYDNRKSKVIYNYSDINWNMDNCKLNYQVPDTERLRAGEIIEKPRVVPMDIDYFMPEAHFYNSMDDFPCEGCDENGVSKPQTFAETVDVNPDLEGCDGLERARDKLIAQGKRLVPYRNVGGARATVGSTSYRVRDKGPMDKIPRGGDKEQNGLLQDDPPVSTVVAKTRIRSFSPIPPDGRCDPLNIPPRGFRPQEIPKRPIKFVVSTKGIQDFVKNGDLCTRPNNYVTDEHRREILRNYRGEKFDDDCCDVDVVRDWPMPDCAGYEESYSSRPMADESIMPVPTRGNVRNMQFNPPPRCKDVKARGAQNFVALNSGRGVRVNAQKRPRRYATVPKPRMLLAVPEDDTARRAADDSLTFPPNQLGFSGSTFSDLMKSNALSVLTGLAVLSLAIMVVNPKIMAGFKNVYSQNERACGYFLAAASYFLIQSTKDLMCPNAN